MTFRLFKLCAFASFAALLEAQQGTINGPVAGYVFDQASQGLRPILGLPGASLLGNPVSFGYNVTAAFVAPRLDAALAVAADGSSHLFTIQDGTLNEVAVDGLAAATSPYRVAFSPLGKSLAFSTGTAALIVTGLPGAPAVGGSVDLSTLGAPDALAVSDDGAALLVSVNNSIHLFGSYADMGKLMDTAGGPAIAFAGGSHDAAISDSGAGLVVYHDLLGSGDSQVVAAPDQSGTPSSAVAFSADGKEIYIANSSAQTVTRVDLVAGASNRLPCACSPTALARMGNVFRLTDLTTDPLWLVDQPESTARVVFVPALQQSAGQ
jgi:hypothetical protein